MFKLAREAFDPTNGRAYTRRRLSGQWRGDEGEFTVTGACIAVSTFVL